jgi:hypothetical protein
MIPIIYVHRFPEDWPTKTDADQPARPVIRIHAVALKKLGSGVEVDSNTNDEVNEGDLYLQVELQYACTHTKLNNLGRWGAWYCAEMNCPHYIGKKPEN